ncbi:IS66 family transposase [Burkholderia thailandensis]|uniref:IS66 family transposase n=1 Tax=Burkholderia thailandensis TaxID=57975 RepID=UPI001EE182F4|nr:IS66 family transposase [Burkholderia thailandensis]
MTPPAVWFAYTPDRKGIHPQQHLETFSGTLQSGRLWRLPGYLRDRTREGSCLLGACPTPVL